MTGNIRSANAQLERPFQVLSQAAGVAPMTQYAMIIETRSCGCFRARGESSSPGNVMRVPGGEQEALPHGLEALPVYLTGLVRAAYCAYRTASRQSSNSTSR